MANRGRGRRGGERNNNPLPSAFDQQAFIEAIGTAIATIAYASAMTATIAIVSQGDPYLKRFKAHHPPTFKGGGDPMVADN